MAATPDTPATWEAGGTDAWLRRDPLNATYGTLNNPTNYLQVVFNSQSRPFPEVHIVMADTNASEGKFTGNYWSTGLTNVTFRLCCETRVPGDLRLYIHGRTSGYWWYYPLAAPTVGEWTTYSVPLNYENGWRIGTGGTAQEFFNDLKDIDWIGIQIQRNSDMGKQTFGLDDFVVFGASPLRDKDADGASDYHEFIAGTDSGNPDSRFDCRIGVTNRVGFAVRWKSAPFREYTIQRSTNLVEGFHTIKTGIAAAPPINEHVDNTATGSCPYFYRILVK